MRYEPRETAPKAHRKTGGKPTKSRSTTGGRLYPAAPLPVGGAGEGRWQPGGRIASGGVHLRLGQEDTAGQVGPLQPRVAQIRSDEVGHPQVGTGQVGRDEVGPAQVGAAQVQARQASSDQISTATVLPATRRS